MPRLTDGTNPKVRLLRLNLIVIAVCVADALIGTFARKPLPWVVAVPSCIPLLVVAWIIVPLRRAEAGKRPGQD